MGWRSRSKSAVAAALAALPAVACLAQTQSADLQLLALVAPPVGGSSGAACAYPASSMTTGPFLTTGTLDVAFADVYSPVVLVASEHYQLTLNGANVRVTDPTGAELASFSVAGDLPLDPLVNGGRGLYATTLIDQATADAVRSSLPLGRTKSLVSNVTVFGTTSAGQTITSSEVAFPVRLCNGCLVIFPAGSTDPSQPQPNCAAPAPSGVFEPCVLGQDQSIDCRTCQSNPACVP